MGAPLSGEPPLVVDFVDALDIHQGARHLENARLILTAAGVTFRDVVQVRSYVARPEDLAEYNQIYREFFSEPYPTRTTIVECLGKALKYEVEMVAYAGD